MKKFVLVCALFFAAIPAQASMIWTAVAVAPAQFEQLKRNPELLTQALSSEGKQAISLDKAWHGIHFLLTGTAWDVKGPAGQAILGGQEFGEDLGYGPARVLSVAQVEAIAEALAKITPENLSVRYNTDAMTKAGIYPTIIWNREGPEALVFLLDYYKPLVTFYRHAAEKGQLVVIAIM